MIQEPAIKWGIVLACALCAGCSSTSDERRVEADEALAPLVESWERHQMGRTSLSDHVKETEIHDPDLERHKFERLLVLYPNHVPSLMANAVVAYDTHAPARAQEYLDRLLAICPVHPDAAVLRARIASDEGNVHLAHRLLEEQIHLTPDHAGLRESYAGVLFSLGRYDEARLSLDAAGRLGAPDWRIAYNRGLVEEAAGAPADAARYYRRAIEAKPEFAPAASRLRALTMGETIPPRIVDKQANADGPTSPPVKH